MRTHSDVAIASDIDSVVMEVVSATSNVLLPFEMVRKAMLLEAHCDNSSKEGLMTNTFHSHPNTALVGLKATDTILQHLRIAGKNALFSTYGEEAKTILSRAAAPGLTMTLEGYFVPGVLENRLLVSLLRSISLSDLHSHSAAESLAKTMVERKMMEECTPELQDLLRNNSRKSRPNFNAKLLTFRRHTDRLMVCPLSHENPISHSSHRVCSFN
jgi:hypothetical protein